jgi:transmembrane sensor
MSSERIEIEAGEWLARLDAGSPSAQLTAAVRAWRLRDPRHEAAFLRLRAAWGKLDRLQALRPPAAHGVDADWVAGTVPAAVPFAERAGPAGPPAQRRRMAYAVAASLALAAGAWLALRDGSTTQDYSTGLGGFERVALADGSLIELNTDTELRVSLTPRARVLELLRGEATFGVAPDSRRPFVVIAGPSAVRALGTRFNVRRVAEEKMEVMVTEGRVAVGARQNVAGPGFEPTLAQQLTQGQSAAVQRDGTARVRQVSATESRRALAWQAGMLQFDGQPLSEVVEEFNRYNSRQLRVADPRAAALTIGGYFQATRPDLFVSVLESSFGLRADREGEHIELAPVESNRK